MEINVYEFNIPSNRYLLDRSTTQETSIFGNGTSIFTFNGTRNSNTNKRIQIEVISQDFEPLDSEILWEIYPDTYTVYVTKIFSNTTSEPIEDKVQNKQSIFTQTIYLSLVVLGLLLTTVILRSEEHTSELQSH